MIDLLGLQKCADTVIGGPLLRGISGGEKKRTAIGVELISNPPLIFMDEPTTGLDSRSAEKVVEICDFMRRKGRTIISTIH
jgi:ABC-type multidrug transport system ATPase subunit